MAIGTYDGSRGTSIIMHHSWGEDSHGQKRWRSEEAEIRVRRYVEDEKLYSGIHNENDGGMFPHPYQSKAKTDKIPYKQVNMMAKGTRSFADLIAGKSLLVTSSSAMTEDFFSIQDYSVVWEALIQSSKFGLVGLQPYHLDKLTSMAKNKTTQEWGTGYYAFSIVHPALLYPEYSRVNQELLLIRKIVEFQDVIVEGDKMSILYEETHYKDRYETRLYEINGEYVKRELPIEYYSYIDPESPQLAEAVYHNLGEFYITLLYNERIGNNITSDYTITAKSLQGSLNRRCTQIDRILTLHSDPKLIAPMSALIKNEDGESYFPLGGNEVMFYDDQTASAEPYKLLTWNGELTQAVANRDNLILDICTEFDLSPSLLSYTHLVGGTSAETASKLEIMMLSTIKRAERKRNFLDKALWVLFSNLISLQKLLGADFSIQYPPIIPQGRAELLAELSQRRTDQTITIKQYNKELDNLSEEEALQRATEVFEESVSNVKNVSFPSQEQEFWNAE